MSNVTKQGEWMMLRRCRARESEPSLVTINSPTFPRESRTRFPSASIVAADGQVGYKIADVRSMVG
jgi:hypothetical protein